MRNALADPALVAEGARTQFPIEYGDAETARTAAINVVVNLTPAQRSRIKTVVLKEQ